MIELLLRGEPCTSCGLRFTGEEKEDYQKHLDWHFSENRLEREGMKSTSRNWNTHYEVLLLLITLLEVILGLLLLIELKAVIIFFVFVHVYMILLAVSCNFTVWAKLYDSDENCIWPFV